MADVVYIDEAEGIKRLMNNGKLYAEILAKFKSDTNPAALERAAVAADWENAQAQAHSIKGVAANLALHELCKHAGNIETQVKGKSLAPRSLEQFNACFAQTLLEVDKVIAKYA
ncbi:MAG: Hpt domain-containing protein [Treponema sp.]|nr:Hpt domain-containing protein [Treponema sp.]